MSPTQDLDDHELDELLAGAAARLQASMSTKAVGAPPAPSFPMRPVIGIAAASVLVAGTVGVLAATSGHRAGRLPAGFAEGRFGTEIHLAEVDDGDHNKDTILLRATPTGGDVQIAHGAPALAQTPTTEATTGGTGGPTPAAPAIDLCITSPAVGVCGAASQFTGPELVLGPRGAAGQALVHSLPGDAAVVAFAAGPEQHWARPVNGVAVFPFGEEATSRATATIFRSDGSVLARLDSANLTPTAAEVAARQISRPTEDTLPQAWTFASPPPIAEWPTGGTFVRRHGRNTLTGFTGPFVIQQLATDRADQSVRSWVAVITVPTSLAEEMRDRLACVAGGGIGGDVTNADGTTVLVWTGSGVKAAARDRVLQGLAPGFPAVADDTSVFDLDIARVWDSGGGGSGRIGNPGGANPLDALLDDVVATVTVDGAPQKLFAGADDLGVVQYALPAANASTSVDPRIAPTPLKVGGPMFRGFVAMPASTTSLSVTLDDGSTVDAELIDVRPLSDVKFALFPASVEHHTIASVSTA